jgi:hypothetical protein
MVIMPEVKKFSLVRPTLQTPLHIDFDWWKQHDGNWRIYLYGYLCPEHREVFSNSEDNQSIDWVDAVTGEVHSVDGLQHVLMTHCAKQPDFITTNTALVDAAFRVFLSNGNAPLNSAQLAEILGKSPDTILRTLAGATVYKGMRPFQNS